MGADANSERRLRHWIPRQARNDDRGARPTVSLVPAFALVFLLMLIPTLTLAAGPTDKKVTFLQKNGKPGPCTFAVEVVTTPEEQARGLMFRERMDADAGMLFDFHGDEMRYFWMRNTLIPLDMIFIGTDMKVVHIHRWAKPKDETNISSKFPARYVLEINGGRAASCRIEAGLKARFINLSP